MNSLPSNINSAKPFNSLPSREDKEFSSKNRAQEGNLVEIAKKMTPATKVSLQKEKVSSEVEQRKPLSDSKETKAYLEIISRLEKKLGDNEFKKGELENVVNSLEERILGFSKDQKKQLLKMEFFKDLKIKNLNEMKDSLFEIFSNEKTQPKGIDFLKSDPLIAMLLNQENGEPFEANNLGLDMLKEPQIDSYRANGTARSSHHDVSPITPMSIKA